MSQSVAAIQLTTEIERIRHSVLRAFVKSIGWQPNDYITCEIGEPPPWERDSNLAVELCATASKQSDAADTLLAVALLLDQSNASVESLAAVLPQWLLNQSAAACMLLARASMRGHDYETAIALLANGVELDPASGKLHHALGIALHRVGQTNVALMHMEASLNLHGGFRATPQTDSRVPVLVATPSQSLEIYVYNHRFYIVPRAANLVGPRVFAGELYIVRRNAGYHILQSLLRIPGLRRLLAKVRGHGVSPRKELSVATDSDVKTNVLTGIGLRLRQSVAESGRAIALRIVLFVLARPIDLQTDTIMNAMELSHKTCGTPARTTTDGSGTNAIGARTQSN